MRLRMYFGKFMKKKVFFLIAATTIVFEMSCLFFNDTPSPKISSEALSGLESNNVNVLGHLKLSDWAQNVPSTAYLTFFQGRSVSTGEIEVRVLYDDGKQNFYLGALTDQLGMPELKTIFIDLGVERCVIGSVASTISGRPLYIHLERDAIDRSDRAYAQKDSTIEKNFFIIPINGDDVYLWNDLTMVAIQTQETLDRDFNGGGSAYEIEKIFDPPLNISSYYIKIPIQ